MEHPLTVSDVSRARPVAEEVASSVLCPWGGGVFDLPEAGFTARAIACCSARCRLCRRGDCSLLGMPRSCDEGLELWGRAPTYPEGSEIRVRRSSCVCSTCDPGIKIFSFGSLKQPVKNVSLTVQMGPVFGGLDARPQRAPVSHAWAYRDFPTMP
ncbi:hypothetical protein CRG98_021681 [Punica granatum]|uniref:Uncharacterized protein n=1 Tax=Punica granatum TaxID=22663 RepID=A0A2I0JNT2_PUNGR|nr:hypothetical protein CRG98_021681 [Punica granatum]